MKWADLKKTKGRALSDAALEALEPEAKEYRVADVNGLYFRVKPSGAKDWQLRYKRGDGSWSWMGVGPYGKATHQLTGAKARKHAAELVAATPVGGNALRVKLSREQAQQEQQANTFERLARAWYEMKRPSWVEATAVRNKGAFEKHIFPVFGHRPFAEITAAEWEDHFRKMQSTGIVEMANRVLVMCRDVLDWAIDREQLTSNPLARTHKRLEAHHPERMKHVTEDELPDLIRSIRGYPGRVAGIGLQLLLLNAVRPSELREAKWGEFDLNKGLWAIPSASMKRKKAEKENGLPHYVPLSRQSVVLLLELQYLTGAYQYLFPGRSDTKKPASATLWIMALRRLGYEGKQTPHGFRHIFSTYANNRGYDERFIEKALAHATPGVKGRYNLADYLQQRTELMQWWADRVDAMSSDKVLEGRCCINPA